VSKDTEPIRIPTADARLERADRKPSRRKAIAFILLGILLACCRCGFALNPAFDVSQYAHTSWKSRDGFPGSIHAIVQTPDGYLWLGTEVGLLRYDGVRFVPGLPPDQHLPSDVINRLLVSRDGTLWIGTWQGLASWKDGRLTQYPQLAGGVIFRIIEDHEGTVWAGSTSFPSPSNLCAFHNGNVKCSGVDNTPGNGVVGLYEDRKGNLWVGTVTGLWRWKPGPPEYFPLPGASGGISNIAEDNDGSLLIFYRGAIVRLVNGKLQTAYPLPGPGRASTSGGNMLRDRDGGLWVSTGDRGLVYIHNGRIDVFALADGLSGDSVQALCEDREGNLWVGTMTGLDRFRDTAVVTFSVHQGLRNFPGGAFLIDRDGSIWLDAMEGLSKWKNGQTTIYRWRGRRVTDSFSLCQDHSGRVWVAGLDGVGYVENDRVIPIDGVPGGFIFSSACGTAGNLWLADAQHGLGQLRGDRTFRQIPWIGLGHKSGAAALAADPAGGLWLGFADGALAFFKNGKITTQYTSRDGLGQGGINTLQLDTDGTLWVGTKGGLSRLKNGRVATLTGKNGLPCDGIDWSMEDDAHSFWLYTDCGLLRIARSELDAWASDPNRTVHVAVFDSSDGVHTRGVDPNYSPNVVRSPDGRVWFTTYDGLSRVADPQHVPLNRLPPPVHIEMITADRKTYQTASSLRLPPLVRDLEIDYTALSLVAPEKVRFKYKLEGRDRDWQDVGDRRQAFYTDLAPRKYRFRVIACNNNGVWNDAGASFAFTIDPAYYQTIWFRAFCVLAFLASLWLLYQLRIRQLQRELNAGVEARVQERTRIARDLHDTLLQSLQGAVFQFQAARKLLLRNADNAMGVVDEAIEAAEASITEGRAAIHDLRPESSAPLDLPDLLNAAGRELAETQEPNTLVPNFRVTVEGKARRLTLPVQDEIYRIAREVIRNAFHHAAASLIEVEIRYDEDQLRLRIRDDGIGISPEILKAGGRSGHWGIPGMRERAKRIASQLDFWSEQDAGTEVELAVPAAKVYEKRSNNKRFRLFRRKDSDGRHS
jgi:signal transduction histidine kinase/ligand-binding sensor domain-containing protein